MELSVFLAKWIGLYYLIFAVLWITCRDRINKTVQDMLSSAGLLAFSGAFALMIGLAIAVGHPVWEWSWRVVITLLGYLAIVQGVLRLVYPEKVREMGLKILNKQAFVSVIAILTILGLFLTYHGFAS